MRRLTLPLGKQVLCICRSQHIWQCQNFIVVAHFKTCRRQMSDISVFVSEILTRSRAPNGTTQSRW